MKQITSTLQDHLKKKTEQNKKIFTEEMIFKDSLRNPPFFNGKLH